MLDTTVATTLTTLTTWWRQMWRKGRHRQVRQVTVRLVLLYAGLGVLLGVTLAVTAGQKLLE